MQTPQPQRKAIFPPAVEEQVAKWQAAEPVIMDENAFVPVPSKFRLYSKKLVRTLTPLEERILALPKIRGISHPKWMVDKEGNIAVVKDNYMYGDQPSAPREKIAADLAYAASIPAAPVRLWKRKDGTFSIVSYKIFSIMHEKPADTFLMSSNQLPGIIAFHQWIKNEDPRPDSLLGCVVPQGTEPTLITVDHAHSMRNYGHGVAPDIQFYFRLGFAAEVIKHMKGLVVKTEFKTAVDQIAEVSTSQIETIVHRLPAEVYGKDDPQKIIDMLVYQRDNLVMQSEIAFKHRSDPRLHMTRPDIDWTEKRRNRQSPTNGLT